jgi:hypothetical protein
MRRKPYRLAVLVAACGTGLPLRHRSQCQLDVLRASHNCCSLVLHRMSVQYRFGFAVRNGRRIGPPRKLIFIGHRSRSIIGTAHSAEANCLILLARIAKRRAVKLYNAGGFLTCRVCCNLRYRTQQVRRRAMLFMKAQKIRARLNAGDSEPGEAWPARPYRMKRRIYENQIRCGMHRCAACYRSRAGRTLTL